MTVEKSLMHSGLGNGVIAEVKYWEQAELQLNEQSRQLSSRSFAQQDYIEHKRNSRNQN